MAVAGVTELPVESAEQVMALIKVGSKNRTTEPTAANLVSSRSHAVLQVDTVHNHRSPSTVDPSQLHDDSDVMHLSVCCKQVVIMQRDRTTDVQQSVKVGKLSMIDLAGSERAAATQNRGLRMVEGANINR